MDPGAIHLSKEATQLANVQTSVVSRHNAVKEVRLYGKVQADERMLQNQVSYLSGRIEKLLVNFTGEPVRKGQPLALIYSPELVTAQQELLEATKTRQAEPAIYEASKEKLRQWKLTESQISVIENSGIVTSNIEIESTTSGIVTARRVNNGDFVSRGSVLYEVSDLSTVWVLFDAYESDLSFLKTGDRIDFTIQALPGSSLSGTIKFIDPVIDPVTRVAKVRLEIGNQGGKLKPEMFVTGIVKANLGQYRDKLVIPRSAVLWTGKRSVVYVKQPGFEEPIFKMRSIDLGPLLGNSFVVTDGLTEGEEIVTQGAFSVDAAAQLEGKPSMMNQEERPVPAKSSEGTKESGQNIGLSKSSDNLQFKVFGNCDMCKERIETSAKSVAGVTSALWNVNTKILQVQFDENKTNIDVIQKIVARTGHDTEKFKASEEGYNQLPSCCLYRKK
jgi:Cu(I)/Ag(I) efflux system membrane fusion protein